MFTCFLDFYCQVFLGLFIIWGLVFLSLFIIWGPFILSLFIIICCPIFQNLFIIICSPIYLNLFIIIFHPVFHYFSIIFHLIFEDSYHQDYFQIFIFTHQKLNFFHLDFFDPHFFIYCELMQILPI